MENNSLNNIEKLSMKVADQFNEEVKRVWFNKCMSVCVKDYSGPNLHTSERTCLKDCFTNSMEDYLISYLK